MIGALPRYALAPLDYRYALDAAMPFLVGSGSPLLVCGAEELLGEARQRLNQWQTPSETHPAASALWIEPLTDTWQADLSTLALRLRPGARLAVIASTPFARLLPERRGWQSYALGLSPGGIQRLVRALPPAGFRLQERFGVHTFPSVALNLLGEFLASLGRPDLGDRLGVKARLRYCTSGPAATLSTVALLFAERTTN